MKRKTTKKIVLIIISILIIALVAVCVIFVVNNKKNKLKDNALQNIISEIRNIGESSNKGKEYIAVSTNGKWGYIDK